MALKEIHVLHTTPENRSFSERTGDSDSKDISECEPKRSRDMSYKASKDLVGTSSFPLPE